MAKTANEEILDATVRHQIKLLRFSEGEARRAAAVLAKSDAEVVKLLQSADLTDFSENRLKRMLADIRRMRHAVAAELGKAIKESMDGLAETEADWELSMLQGATPVDVAYHSVSAATIKAVAGSPVNGVPLEGWLGKMSVNDVSRIEQQLRLGITQGETMGQLVQRIRGTKAANYADGVLSTTRREAEMIARTASNHASASARQAVWEANEDIMQGVRWVATLDGRTSDVCAGLDGEVYPVREGPRPPAHPNCRSSVAPVLAGEEIVGERSFLTDTRTRRQREIDFRAEAKSAVGKDKWKAMTEPERRAAIAARRKAWAAENIGTVPSKTTYQDWLKGQSREFQDEVLGPGKAELFRKGMPLSKFVDEKGKPYSLAQLKAELAADKLHVVQPGVGLKAKALLQQGMSNQDVLDQIKKEFPDASTSLASVASYKSELKKAGALTQAQPVPIGALKQAKSVQAVVDGLDASLPPGVQHALGKQWSTVVEDLDGSPGAYGYYQAGKGVVLSGKKLSAMPAAQARQVAAHELGHLIHKQHDVLLPGEVLAAAKSAAKALPPDARKLYSYYLSSPDELVAEIYAQAISPSPMTSQGLSALQFNNAFADAIQAAKKSMADKFPVPSAAAKPAIPGGPVLPYEVAGKHSTVGSLAKALLQQGMPDDGVLKAVLAEFPTAKTKIASIKSYKSELKKQGLLPNKASGPVVQPKPIPGVTPTPPSPEAAVAAPKAAAATPSSVKLSAADLKAEGMKLLQQGMLKNADVATTLDNLFPLNAGQIKPTTVATWKSLWKKADPKGFAAASELSKKATFSALTSGPKAKPKLYGVKLGGVSNSALNKVKSVLAAGGTNGDAYDAMKAVFGDIKEPGASDLLELAKYELATLKASGKPYLDSAYSKSSWLKKKPTEIDVDMTPARPAATPREGLPPPPRFRPEQHRYALRRHGGNRYVPEGVLSRINERQKMLGLEEVTQEEAAAIVAYTGYSYKTLNRLLRGGAYPSDAALQAYVEAAQHGLMKLPKYRGLSARGAPFSEAELKGILSTYRKNAVVEEASFTSSSLGDKAAFSGNVYWRIHGKSGVHVEKISDHPSEREVLFMPGTRFHVDSVEQINGKYIITMTEID